MALLWHAPVAHVATLRAPNASPAKPAVWRSDPSVSIRQGGKQGFWIGLECKWGLYGDTAYINPAIFKGTIRQRTVGSSAHFKENQLRFRCMSLKRWQT